MHENVTHASALLKNGIMAKDMTRLKILLSEMEVRFFPGSLSVFSLWVSHIRACLNTFSLCTLQAFMFKLCRETFHPSCNQ